MSKFEETMSALGYVFEEQDGKKLTYRKRTRYADKVLVVDLELKCVNPILVPSSLVLYERDLAEMILAFKEMRKDAELIAEMSNGSYKVLNK